MRSREWPVKHIRVAKENCRAFSFLLNLDYDLTALKCNIISKQLSYQNNRLYTDNGGPAHRILRAMQIIVMSGVVEK